MNKTNTKEVIKMMKDLYNHKFKILTKKNKKLKSQLNLPKKNVLQKQVFLQMDQFLKIMTKK